MNDVMHVAERNTRLYLIVSIVAGFAGILFGYDTGVISGAILYIQKEFIISPQMNGIVVGMVLVGAFAGALLSGHLSDVVGRKRLLVVDTMIFIAGTAMCGLASSIWMLIVGRIVVGVAIGVSSYSAPLYIAEIAPPKHRGALVSLNQLALAIGILISYLVDYHFSHTGDWRAMFLVGILPAAGLLVGMIMLPYSPRWMASHGKDVAALRILKKIRGTALQAEDELREIKDSLRTQSGSWAELFKPFIRPALLVGVGLAILQQATGINTILYYAPTIFTSTGVMNASNSIYATILVGVVFTLFTIVSLFIIDRWGRRIILMTGISLMAVSLLVMSLAFFHAGVTGKILKWTMITSMMIYIVGFSISLGPVMWLMFSEVFPLRVRGFGASLCTAVNWAANWAVTVSFLSIVEWFGQGTAFFMYFIVCIVSLAFVYWIVPETRGVTLEHIEASLYSGRKARHLGDP
jgi:sugar porter (SP) family MFS transporter